MDQLNSLEIHSLECKSWVANEFFDLLTCFDLPDRGLDKFMINFMNSKCEPFEEEVIVRLAGMCPNLTHL